MTDYNFMIYIIKKGNKMKKLLTWILLLLLSAYALAKDIDMNKSKGTEQNVIVSLTPSVANVDVDKDVILKAVFNVDFDANHVKKNDIKLKYITQTKESIIDGNVEYIADEQAVTFTPNKLLEDGFYEIEFKSLKTTKANKNILIKEIKYRFYVPEVVNGFKLPMEPDPVVNNASLLGIDSNDNGVRDDIERYIIKTYKDEKIAIEIGFQLARAYNAVIENPANAEETTMIMSAAIDCETYFDTYTKLFKEDFYLENEIDSKLFKSMNLNTEERIRAFLVHNKLLSGGVYRSTNIKDMKKSCTFDVEQMIKDR